jgi:acyl phosphate:glycerol-3-phosphate acyltransferase
VIAFVAAYLWGGIPTADLIARSRDIDLRAAGSRNPGANNALRLGGKGLGAVVLVVEVFKGLLAARVGAWLAGDAGMAASSVGALAGNVFNPYYRGRGGKGLGITAGLTLGAWPTFLPAALAISAAGFIFTRRSGHATLMIAGAFLLGAALWTSNTWPTGWGLQPGPALVWLGVGVACLLVPRAVKDAVHPMEIESI